MAIVKRNTEKLRAVLRALKDLELARLAAAAHRQNELSTEINRLRLARITTQHRALDHSALTPSSLTGADTRWANWAAAQIEDKNIGLARLAAEREQIMARAQKSHGRAIAFDALLAKRRQRASRV